MKILSFAFVQDKKLHGQVKGGGPEFESVFCEANLVFHKGSQIRCHPSENPARWPDLSAIVTSDST